MDGRSRNPKDNKSIDAVFFSEKHNVLSLKHRTVTIELNKRTYRSLYRGVLFVALIVVCAGVIGVARLGRVRADTNLYPQSCLGGWKNSAHAVGVPDLDGRDDTAYNSSNSASVSNVLAEIYCGSFTGDVPDATVPTKLTLSLSWAVVIPQTTVISGNSYASSTSQILAAPDNDTTQLEITATSSASSTPSDQTSAPASGTSPPDQQTAPPAETVPDQSAPPAAPPDDVPAAPAPTDQPTPPAAPQDSTVQSLISRALHVAYELISPSRAYAQTDTSLASTTDATTSDEAVISAASSSPASAPLPGQDIVEVLYTLDGTTWKSLGTVSRSYLKNAAFDIPLDGVQGWGDLTKLQIGVRSLSTLDDATTIYLDGMTLSVDYAQAPDQTQQIQQDLPDTPLTVTYVANAAPDFTVSAITGNDGNPALEFSAPDAGNLVVFRGIRQQIFFTAGLGNQPSQFPLYTFPPDTYTALDTKNPEACTSTIDACQTAPGYVSESIFTVSVATSTPAQ